MIALPDASSTALGWLAAVNALRSNSNRCYNLAYVIEKPAELQSRDLAIIRAFDEYASTAALHSVETVANTIFPLDTYRSQGADKLYDYYSLEILPRVSKQWGTYFERMISRRNADGSLMMLKGKKVNPLANIIAKASARIARQAGSKTHYELSIEDPRMDLTTYQPQLDGRYHVGGPCLSHLSFKIDADNMLRLTALYRSHWYVARALGNLIGLARLQSFVASQAGISAGPLTIIASEATLDISGHVGGSRAALSMIERCKEIALAK